MTQSIQQGTGKQQVADGAEAQDCHRAALCQRFRRFRQGRPWSKAAHKAQRCHQGHTKPEVEPAFEYAAAFGHGLFHRAGTARVTDES